MFALVIWINISYTFYSLLYLLLCIYDFNFRMNHTPKIGRYSKSKLSDSAILELHTFPCVCICITIISVIYTHEVRLFGMLHLRAVVEHYGGWIYVYGSADGNEYVLDSMVYYHLDVKASITYSKSATEWVQNI